MRHRYFAIPFLLLFIIHIIHIVHILSGLRCAFSFREIDYFFFKTLMLYCVYCDYSLYPMAFSAFALSFKPEAAALKLPRTNLF